MHIAQEAVAKLTDDADITAFQSSPLAPLLLTKKGMRLEIGSPMTSAFMWNRSGNHFLSVITWTAMSAFLDSIFIIYVFNCSRIRYGFSSDWLLDGVMAFWDPSLTASFLTAEVPAGRGIP